MRNTEGQSVHKAIHLTSVRSSGGCDLTCIRMSVNIMEQCDIRHDDDGEVQPVPGISQEGERHYTESSGKYLDRRLKGVNSSKSIPEKYIHKKGNTVSSDKMYTCIGLGLCQPSK